MDNDIEEILTSLRKVIQEDRNYYDKVLNDPLFKNVRSHVLVLRDNMFQETRLKTEKELSSLEIRFKQYTNIPDTLKLPTSTTEMIEKTKNDITIIKRKMKNNSYFDFLDSLEMIASINNRLIKIREEIIGLRHSSKNHLIYLDTDLRNANSRLDEVYTKLKNLKSLRVINIIIAIVSLFSIYIFLIANETDNFTPFLFSVILISLGLGMVDHKSEIGKENHTIQSWLGRYISSGIMLFIGVLFLIVVLGIVMEIYNSLANKSVSIYTIVSFVFCICAIPIIITLIIMLLPDKNISKIESIRHDEKRSINNIESAINENNLIVSTLKSF